MERRWLTPAETAEYLSLHVKTIYAQAARGEIPASKIGGSIRIDKKRLDEQLEAREVNFDELIDKVGIG